MSEQWPVKPIADICEIFSDGNWIESKDQSPSGIRLVQTGNIGEGVFKDRKDKARYISESTFSRLNCTEIFEGDCLISRLPRPVGRACLIPNTGERMITAVDCSILRFKQDMILPQFFVYYSQSAHYNNQIQPLCTGSTRKRISRKNLGKIRIPIPPLDVQQRIVSVLDEAFEKINNSKEQLEQKLAGAKEIYYSVIHSQDEDKAPLGTFVDIKTGKLNSNAAVEGGQYPFFTCSRKPSEIDHYAFDCEAILLAGNNASGDFNVKHYSGKFNAYQRTYVITISDKEKLTYRYLYHQMVKSLKELKSSSVGTGTKFLKLGMIKDLQINVPSLDKQITLQEQIGNLENESGKLEKNYLCELEMLDEFKQSILQEAFNGTLRIAEGLAGQS